MYFIYGTVKVTELKFQQITAGNFWVLLASFITKFPPFSHISSDLKILNNCPSLQQRDTHRASYSGRLPCAFGWKVRRNQSISLNNGSQHKSTYSKKQ